MFLIKVIFCFHLIFFFFFNDTATTEIYTLSLHDALPILSISAQEAAFQHLVCKLRHEMLEYWRFIDPLWDPLRDFGIRPVTAAEFRSLERSEEHTSELQSLTNLVCRLLLENEKAHD